jgi:hypothetical protein
MPADDMITGAAPPSLLEEAVASGTALADIGLRTAAATIVAATLAPFAMSRRALAGEAEQLEFYASLAAAGDAAAVFRAPPGDVPMRIRRISALPLLGAAGRIDRLSFQSPFEALNPVARDAYASHRRNAIARAEHWRHVDRPRPTIIVIHGFMASPYLVNSAFFSLPWFFAGGYDVLLVTLPFHGARAARISPYSGYGLFAHGMAHINEAILQAVSDIRVLVGYLLDAGAPRVGVTGISLGGYTTAALASSEPRLHFAIPNAAVVELSGVVRAWFPAGALVGAALAREGLTLEDLGRSLAVHSALSYHPVIPHERLFIIGGLGDRLAPPEQSLQLWEHWDRCRLHWYPGNHILHVSRGDYLRQMGRFLSTGFAEDA